MAEKKYKVEYNGKVVKFGAKGYSIAPGTKKGDAYCSRSAGIKTEKGSPNFFSRGVWGCKGSTSSKSRASTFKKKWKVKRV